MKGLNNIIKTIDGVKFDSPFFRAPILICGDVETVCSWDWEKSKMGKFLWIFNAILW